MGLATEEKRLTTEDVCRILNISKATLHRYRAQGRINPANDNPNMDRPKALEFTMEEVERFQKAQRLRREAQGAPGGE